MSNRLIGETSVGGVQTTEMILRVPCGVWMSMMHLRYLFIYSLTWLSHLLIALLFLIWILISNDGW